MKDFKTFGILDELVRSLERLNILEPTQIQIETIPPALLGSDLLASAQTGSGKTIAYSIPLIMKLANSDRTAIILTPTRELAAQVSTTLKKICGSAFALKSALLIGGDSMYKQMAQLRAIPNVIVGTPGRVFDHLNRGSLCLDKVGMLVIDEADRMLDMGFEVQLEQILEYLPSERQTLLFSATVPPNIEKLSRKYLKDPKRVAIGSSIQPPSQLKQEIIHTTSAEKFPILLDEINKREGSIVVFVKTKRGADRLMKDLQRNDHNADAIHGDLQQRRRERVILAFRKGQTRILVATDVAARGLDIPHIRHVINYDLPQCPEDYIHRIGRTARAGADGEALCLVTREDGVKWKAIHRMMNPGSVDKDGPSKDGPRRNSSRGPKREGFRSGPRREGFRSESRGDKPFRSRSDAPRGDRPFRTDAPRGDRPFRNDAQRSDTPRGDRPFRSDAPRGDRPFRSDAPRGDRPFRSDAPRSERPFQNDAPREQRPFRSEGNFPRSDRPNRAAASDAPRGDRPFRSDAPRGDRPFRSEAPREGGFRSRPPRREGEAFQSDRPRREAPAGESPRESRGPGQRWDGPRSGDARKPFPNKKPFWGNKKPSEGPSKFGPKKRKPIPVSDPVVI